MKNVAIGTIFAISNIVSIYIGVGITLFVFRERANRLKATIDRDEQLRGTNAKKYVESVFGK